MSAKVSNLVVVFEVLNYIVLMISALLMMKPFLLTLLGYT